MEHTIEKVIFVARDGDIYRKVFNLLFKDIKNEYLYWSRIPAAILSTEFTAQTFLESFISQKVNDCNKTTIGGLLSKLKLESLEKYLVSYKLSVYSNIDMESEKILKKFFLDHWDEVRLLLQPFIRDTKDYIKSVIGESKKIAIVDVGWTGKNIINLKTVIKDSIPECGVDCLLAGFRSNQNQYIPMRNDIKYYLFASDYNRDLYNSHCNKDLYPMNTIFELFTQAKDPSFFGVYDGKYMFDTPELENHEMIEEIQTGILKFADIYSTCFKNYKYMWNISGYDAYLPFRQHIRNLDFIRNFLGDFSMRLNVLSGENELKNTTIRQILQKK